MTDHDESRAVLRAPPASIEAEQALLGSCLLDPRALGRVHLAPEAFFRSSHVEIYSALRGMAQAGREPDPISVWEWMRDRGQDRTGSLLAEINALAQSVPSGGGAARYAAIVQDKALLRAVISASDESSTAALNPNGKTPAEILDAAQMRLAKLATTKRRRDPQHIRQSLADYLGLLQDLSEGKNPALATGIAGLDRILNGGMRRGEMMVIGARPKHGKTALALALARNFARRYDVLFLSQEMPVSQLMHRHTAAAGTIDIGRILRAEPGDGELWERVNDAARSLESLRLVHDDQCALSLLDIRRKAVQVRRQHGLDVLFVDFLQLMQGAGEDNRNRELDVIVNGIKQLALDLEIVCVVLSQMSRKADEHYSRPTMTYLRDSGAIEAAADQIALLFTDHAHPLSPKLDNFIGYSELEIVAHRNGPQGLVPLDFRGAYQQMGDWDGRIPSRPSSKGSRGME